MEKVVADFWKNRKVFLTGHTGFKGSWLSLWLQEMGAKVTGYSLPAPTNPSLYIDADVEKGMRSIIADIRDLDLLKKSLQQDQPEIVIHMAAQPLVRYSYANPVETYSTNVMGTLHVLEAIRATKSVRATVVVTSDKCYENKEWHWAYRENEAMGGYDPYSSSKGCTEILVASYRQSYFSPERYLEHKMALATARAGNVIGGGDWADERLIPDILRALIKNEEIKIRNPKAIRPWQHVLEPLSGYLLLAQKLYQGNGQFAEAYNFGPYEHDVQNVESLVQSLLKKWQGSAKYKIVDAGPFHEAQHLKLDCSKAQTKLGWTPHWNLEKTLQSIVDWNIEYAQNSNQAKEVTVAQINEYMNSSVKGTL